MKLAILIIFITTYAGIAAGGIRGLKLDRTGVALLGAIAMLGLGEITLNQAISSINFESILLLFALMVISSQLQHAGFYHKMAEFISRFLNNPTLFLFILMFTAGILSAFLNNDVVCFAFAPVIIIALLKKRLNPVPFLIALALSSNIGCALTIIGNAQDVLIGQLGKLSFGGYMLWAAVPVTISMLLSYIVILILGKKSFFLQINIPQTSLEKEFYQLKPWRMTKGLIAVTAIIILFFFPIPKYLVALVAAGILLCSHKLESKDVLKLVDWQLLILFMGLFVVVGAFSYSGFGVNLIEYMKKLGIHLNNSYTLAVTTGVLSNMINNSAAVMFLVHIIDLTKEVNCYILAMANTFAGNFLLIGSVANLIVVKEAKDLNINISFMQFAKYGIPSATISFIILISWVFIMAG